MECPICQADAEELAVTFDGYALKCPTHGEFEFSGTVNATRQGAPREAWEHALTTARTRAIKSGQSETLAGKRPRIVDTDF
jgi:hypothetical protein